MKDKFKIKIISFNIWDLPILFVNRKKGRRRRIDLLREYLDELDADIICLQESFDIKHRKLIYDSLVSKGYYATDGMDKGRLVPMAYMDTTGGLVIFSKFKITEEKFIPFKIFEYSIFEYFGRKGVLEAVVETPVGLLHVINTHLHSGEYNFDKKIRLSQLNRVFKVANGKRGMPIVFTGDLNQHAIIDNKEFDVLSEHDFIHPVLEEGAIPKPTYRRDNPFVNGFINRSSKRLDYIFVRHLEKYNLNVVKYSPIHLKPAVSDHDPVLIFLST